MHEVGDESAIHAAGEEYSNSRFPVLGISVHYSRVKVVHGPWGRLRNVGSLTPDRCEELSGEAIDFCLCVGWCGGRREVGVDAWYPRLVRFSATRTEQGEGDDEPTHS